MRAETLLDAINLAYRTNPTLQQQRATLRALDETYVQARAALRPTLNVTGGDNLFHTSENNSTFLPGPFQSNTQSATVNLVEPLTTGGVATKAIKAALHDVLQGREQLRATEIQIMAQVVQFYVDTIRDTQALRIDRALLLVLQRQLQQTSAEFDVGQVTRTDVSQAEARLALAQAAVSAAEGQLQVSRANFTDVVGEPPGDLTPPPALPGVPTSFDAALNVAEKENPALLGAQYAEEAARARVGEARAAYRPSVSINASFEWQHGLIPFSNNPYQRTVAASAVATIPLFSGGFRGSRVRQALEVDNETVYGIQIQQRFVLQTVSQQWATLLSTHAQTLAQEEQVKSAAVAAEGQRQEAQIGLRTTIDVLNAEQEYATAQLQLVIARHDEYVATSNLLAGMGRLEIRYLNPDLPAYDPERNFDRVRNKGWLPIDPVVEALDAAGAPREHNPYTPTSAPIDPDLAARSADPDPKEP